MEISQSGLSNSTYLVEQYKIAVDTYNKLQDKIFEIHKFFVTLISSFFAASLFIINNKLLPNNIIKDSSEALIFIIFMFSLLWGNIIIGLYKSIKLHIPIIEDMEDSLQTFYVTKILESTETNKLLNLMPHLLLPLIFIIITFLFLIPTIMNFVYLFVSPIIEIIKNLFTNIQNFNIKTYIDKNFLVGLIGSIISTILGYISILMLKNNNEIVKDMVEERRNFKVLNNEICFSFINRETEKLETFIIKAVPNIRINYSINSSNDKSLSIDLYERTKFGKEKNSQSYILQEFLSKVKPKESMYDIELDEQKCKNMAINKMEFIKPARSNRNLLRIKFINVGLISAGFKIT